MVAVPPDRIWLIGLMGCGKSTVGAHVGGYLGEVYIDNDATIATMAGRSTVDLAAAGGDLLHDWESRYVERLVGLVPPVVAGIPASIAERPDDLAQLRAAGLLVYLRCDLATLVARVRAGPPRPWLSADPEPLLAAMLTRRDPLLRAASALVMDGTRPAADLAAEIGATERLRVS
jgi:shikimate kinase